MTVNVAEAPTIAEDDDNAREVIVATVAVRVIPDDC